MADNNTETAVRIAARAYNAMGDLLTCSALNEDEKDEYTVIAITDAHNAMSELERLFGKDELIRLNGLTLSVEPAEELDTCDKCEKPSAELAHVGRDGYDFLCPECCKSVKCGCATVVVNGETIHELTCVLFADVPLGKREE